MENGQKLLNEGYVIKRIVLRTAYQWGKTKKNPSVTISADNLSWPVLPKFEQWLEDAGISINYNEAPTKN